MFGFCSLDGLCFNSRQAGLARATSLSFIYSHQASVGQQQPEAVMAALASAVHQHLQSALISQHLHVFLRSRLLNFQVPKPSGKGACSGFSHVLQVLLNYSRGSGALELAHITRRKDLGRKGNVEPDQETSPPAAVFSWFLFGLHKESPRDKKRKIVSDGFQRNLKAVDPDEEQQRRGDADNRWCWIPAC